MPECYIRGSTIKYLRIPGKVRLPFALRSLLLTIIFFFLFNVDEVIDMVKEEVVAKGRGRGDGKGRGGAQRGGRGGNRGTHYLKLKLGSS